MKTRRIKYLVDKNGIKYPYYNQSYNSHPIDVKRYSNIGNDHREPECFDLPKDGYPYTVIYEN